MAVKRHTATARGRQSEASRVWQTRPTRRLAAALVAAALLASGCSREVDRVTPSEAARTEEAAVATAPTTDSSVAGGSSPSSAPLDDRDEPATAESLGVPTSTAPDDAPRPEVAPPTTTVADPASPESGRAPSAEDLPAATDDSNEAFLEPIEPTPVGELALPDSAAPAWPFRGLIEGNFYRDSDNDRSGLVLRYHSSQDRTTTEIVVQDVEPSGSYCWSVNLGTVSEAGVIIGAGRDLVDAAGELTWESVDVVVPWGEAAKVVPPQEFPDGEASWSDIMLSAYDADRGHVIGGMPFDISIHANGVRVRAGEEAGRYLLADLAGIEGPPPEDLTLYGDITSSWDQLLFLGTDGEFVAFGTWPYEPACGPQRQYVVSLRTGEVVACRRSSNDLALVQPPNQGLLVENVVLAGALWVGDQQCDHTSGSLTEFWSALLVPPDPYPPVTTPPEPDVLPADTAPQWPFRGAVLAFQRYDSERFDYDIVLQYHSSDGGSVTEIVFGPVRLRSQELVVEASQDGVEVSQTGWPAWRTNWRVRVPWGGSPERLAVDPDRVAQLRAEEYPTVIEFGSRRIEIDPYHIRDGRYGYVLAIRLAVDGEHSWHVWSKPRDDLINTELEMSSELVYESVWLRGTDGRTAAISRWEYPEICGWLCDPLLTYMVSFETGEVLSCGLESSGEHALAFVAPRDAESDSEFVLPPSGWLDLDGAECNRLFELAATPGSASGPVPTRALIQADTDRHRMLIQPAHGG